MKRDMDLVRAILLAVETHPSGFAPSDIEVAGYTKEQVGYHALLMLEAGLVEGAETSCMGDESPNALITRLTWQGHEFLEAARQPTIWAQAKAIVVAKGGSASFQVWLAVLTDLVKRSIGV